jgi:hypothetical protein
MEQGAAVRVLTLEKLSARDIAGEWEGLSEHDAQVAFGDDKWRKRFANRRITLEDDPRSGRSP